MDYPPEYLDAEFSKEHANQKKRRSTAKSKIHLPAKLGKYSLSSQDVKETEPLPDDEADGGDTYELIEILAEYQDLLPEILPRAADNVEYDDENDESTQNRTYVRYTAEAGGDRKDGAVADDEAAASGSSSDAEDGGQEPCYADETGGDPKEDSVADDEAAAAGSSSDAEDGEQEACYAYEAGGDPKDGSVTDDDDADGLSGVITDQRITEDRGTKGQKVHFRQNKNILKNQADLFERIDRLDEKVNRLLPKLPSFKMSWPVADLESLQELEKRLRSNEKGLEDGLKAKMNTATRNSIDEFLKQNLKNLFGRIGRFSWTGSVAKNAKHNEKSNEVRDLACIQLLIECCCEIFGVDSSKAETEVKEALTRRNEADLKRKYRHGDPAAMPSTSVTSHQSKTNPPKSSTPRVSKKSSQTSSSSCIANTKTPPSNGRATPSSTLASSSSIPSNASPASNAPNRTNSTTASASASKKTSKTPLMVRSDAEDNVKPNTTAAKQKLKNKERLVPTNNSSHVAGSGRIPTALPETIKGKTVQTKLSSSPASSITKMFDKVKSSTPSKASSSNNSRSGTGTF